MVVLVVVVVVVLVELDAVGAAVVVVGSSALLGLGVDVSFAFGKPSSWSSILAARPGNRLMIITGALMMGSCSPRRRVRNG